MERSVVAVLLTGGGAGVDADWAIGTHLVTERIGYTHHGIYAGGGKVVHYAGLSLSLRRGPVEEVTLAEFANGHRVWGRHSPDVKYAGVEAACRAYSRLGEDCYRLVSNNCEHFCTWCLYGESRSEQIDVWRSRAIDVLRARLKSIKRLTIVTVKTIFEGQSFSDSSWQTIQPL